MKKIVLLLSSLLFVSCSTQNISNQNLLDGSTQQIFANKTKLLTAKSAYPIALKKINSLLSKPQLFEIDVWQESDSNKIHFGFMQKNSNGSYKFIRVIIDRETNEVTHEQIGKGGKIPAPVNLDNWEVDNELILKNARKNGLRDQTFLATLWDNTWHISGLKQHLYFQMNSKDGEIIMRCIGPYLNQCTDADLNPINKILSTDFQNRLNSLK